MVLWVNLDTLHAVGVGVAVQTHLEASHSTVGSNQRHLLLHVVLPTVIQGLEVFAESFRVAALLE